jgi:hypothetical protein
MDTRKARAEQLAGLLEAVASGTVSSTEALSVWGDVESDDDAVLGTAWHVLHHFDTDADIRARDQAYDLEMRGTLERTANTIRSHTNRDSA